MLLNAHDFALLHLEPAVQQLVIGRAVAGGDGQIPQPDSEHIADRAALKSVGFGQAKVHIPAAARGENVRQKQVVGELLHLPAAALGKEFVNEEIQESLVILDVLLCPAVVAHLQHHHVPEIRESLAVFLLGEGRVIALAGDVVTQAPVNRAGQLQTAPGLAVVFNAVGHLHQSPL